MPVVSRSTIRKVFLALGLALLVAVPASSQTIGNGISDTFGLADKTGKAGNPADWTAVLKPGAEPNELILTLSVQLAPGYHVYSPATVAGALMKFSIVKTAGLSADGGWVADHEPESVFDSDLKKTVEIYHDSATWSQKLVIGPDVNPSQLTLSGKVNYQICGGGICSVAEFDFKARLANEIASETTSRSNTKTFAPKYFDHFEKNDDPGSICGRWVVIVTPHEAAPGEEVTLTVQADVVSGWHVYPIDMPVPKDGGSVPTIITLIEANGLSPAGEPIVAPPANEHPSSEPGVIERYHEGRLIWRRKFTVSKSAAHGEINLVGLVAWQACTQNKCIQPVGFEFNAKLNISDETKPGNAEVKIGRTLKSPEVLETLETPVESGYAGLLARVESVDLAATPNAFVVPPIVKPAREVSAKATLENDGDEEAAGASEESHLSSMPLSVFLLTAMAFGFAALLTPCVFPMIPITVSFFQKQAEKEHHRPVSMATIYCL